MTVEANNRKEKKKMSRGTKILLIVVCVLVALAVLLVAAALILTNIGRQALTDETGMELSQTISYKGKQYQYNDEITSILLMGVDSYEKEDTDSYGGSNQSDVNVLAVIDPKNEKLTLLAISRDTMCKIDVLDSNGEFSGTADAQLALAYSFGDGGDKSCELTSTAVSRLFYGLHIPAYASIYMNGISDLVDIVGGVTVTPSDSFNGFTAGKQVDLRGGLTEKYIRFREHTVEGNNQRMQRQNQVLMALVYKALHCAKDDPTSILDIYGGVQDNVTTNVNTAMMVYLARQAVKLNFDGQIHTVPGHSEMGEQNHAVFVIDEEAFYEQILDIFYCPVEK